MPFLGASMGRMLSGATEGMARGQLQRMMWDRDQDRWNQQMDLKREALGVSDERTQVAAREGFIKGAMNFWKATGDAEATKRFWNQNAPQYGLERIATFQPIDPSTLHVHFENGRGLVVNKLTGASRLVTGPDGDAFQMPEKPTFQTIQEGDENVTYQLTQDGGRVEIGRGPKWSGREGLEITTKDGTVIRQGGSGKTATGLQPTTQKKVEEELLDNAANLVQIKQIRERYQPEFATYAGQARGLWYKIKEKAGSELAPDEQDYANKFYGYRSEAVKLQADIMRRMSGTAVTPTEEARQKTYVIDPGTGVFDGDSPEQVRSKMDRFENEMRRVVARLNYVRKNGLSIRNVSLDTMDKILQDRAEVIEGKLRAQGVPREKLAEQVLRQLSEEFGLVY